MKRKIYLGLLIAFLAIMGVSCTKTSKKVICPNCSGTGKVEERCRVCKGSGQGLIYFNDGSFSSCDQCKGSGTEVKNCTVCKGTGRVNEVE